MVVVKAQPGQSSDAVIRAFQKKVLNEDILGELKKAGILSKAGNCSQKQGGNAQASKSTHILMLLDQIKSDLVQAQKSRDQEKIDTLRFLLSALKYVRIEKYPQAGDDSVLSDEDVITVLQKQVKTHKESIDMFKQGNRQDLVDRENGQLQILQSYLPALMSEEEVRAKISELRSKNQELSFGDMMKMCMAELKGKADGGMVSKILREMIQS